MADEGRLETLREMLAEDPEDTFTRYALAMELKGLGRRDEAAATFEDLLGRDPEYVPTFHQCALLYQERGDVERALGLVERGIALAAAQGERHAQAELEDLQRELEGLR